MNETIVHTAGAVSHYFGAEQPYLVAFDIDGQDLEWVEVLAPHEEVAALRFWDAATERPINQLLVREHGAELAALILIERDGNVAYATDVEVDER